MDWVNAGTRDEKYIEVLESYCNTLRTGRVTDLEAQMMHVMENQARTLNRYIAEITTLNDTIKKQQQEIAFLYSIVQDDDTQHIGDSMLSIRP